MGSTLDAAAVYDPHLSACVHNEILRRGCDGAGHDLDLSFEESTAAWWDTYGLECNATGIASKLAPELVEFLRSDRVILPKLVTQVHELYAYFFYYLTTIALPEEFFRSPIDCEEPDLNRYLLLYHAANVMSHPLGLVLIRPTHVEGSGLAVFDNRRHHCREEATSVDTLQDILAGYIEMLDLGKIVIEDDELDCDEDEDFNEDLEAQYRRINKPWLVNPHSQAILERTVTAFSSLLKAIKERMPRPAINTAETGLVKERTFGMAQVAEKLVATHQVSRNNFIVKFLRKVDHSIVFAPPYLQFIAPGLRIPGDDLADQLFEGIDYHTSPNNNPILLFRGAWSDGATPLTTFPGGVWNPFPSPYARPPSGFPSGLWIAENHLDSPDFDDICRLLPPDRLLDGTQHHAKSTDGFLLEQPGNRGEGLSAGLFQTSYKMILNRHEVQLFRVLEHWIRMVEVGTWTVDEHGVAGGMEKWAEADADVNIAEKYRLPYTW